MKRKGVPRLAEETPHLVEWMVSPESEDCDWAYFTRMADAQLYGEEKVRQKYSVWVSEIGDYSNKNNQLTRGWVCYWWDQSTDWGQVDNRGKGYSSPTAKYMVEYTPFDKTGWER